jgi:hypothetical protein
MMERIVIERFKTTTAPDPAMLKDMATVAMRVGDNRVGTRKKSSKPQSGKAVPDHAQGEAINISLRCASRSI